MIVEDYKPKSELLQDAVMSYYFNKSEDNTLTEFSYYPHYIETINIFKNASVRITDKVFEVDFAEGSCATILSVGKSVFRKAVVKNQYDITGIHFKPLALRSFFNLNALVHLGKGVFYFKEPQEIERVCELADEKERGEALEQFLLNAYQPTEVDDIAKMVNSIHQTGGKITIKELEQLTNLSRRTILRRFQKHLYCSFEEYKNIVRFRIAIDNFNEKNQFSKEYLKDDLYYDQSDFINHFKNLTGESPNKLLSYIKSNSKSLKYFWKFYQP